MLDRTNSGPECSHYPGLSVAVRHHDAFGSSRLFDDRTELFVTELLMYGVVQLAHHATRCADLDHPGAEAQLRSDSLQAFRHAVAQPSNPHSLAHIGHRTDRKRMKIAMATGLAQDRAGRIDAWPG